MTAVERVAHYVAVGYNTINWPLIFLLYRHCEEQQPVTYRCCDLSGAAILFLKCRIAALRSQ